MKKSPLEVSIFVPEMASHPPPTLSPIPRRPRPWSVPRRRALGSVVCATVTIGLHLAFLAPFLGGGTGRDPEQSLMDRDGGTGREDGARMEVRIIEEPEIGGLISFRRRLLEPTLADVSLSFPSVAPAVPLLKQAGAHADRLEARSAARGANSALEQDYLGRINNGVARTWQPPKVPLAAPQFSCRVRIDLDGGARIKEIALEGCDSNVRWRLALLAALQSASPLSTAGDSSLSRSTLHITFVGHGRGSPVAAEGNLCGNVPMRC
jgi:hypothetical protein